MHFQRYSEQVKSWPQEGRHIMAQFNDESLIVYQAYSHQIAEFAVKHQYFGDGFSYARMSWIKPNFLWMMFRSGWAGKVGQERVLAIRIRRSFFDEILSCAVVSSYDAAAYPDQVAWKQAIETSDVRLQWDPDHDPAGNCVKRRAVQLGLRGETLRRYGKEAILEISDMTAFVREQYRHLASTEQMQDNLLLPTEIVYRSC